MLLIILVFLDDTNLTLLLQQPKTTIFQALMLVPTSTPVLLDAV